MTDNKSVSISTIMTFAGTYIATIIGSGYATGQEIMQFFSYYGYQGVIGAIIAWVLFTWIGMECLNRGRLVKPTESTKIYRLYLGDILGGFLEWFGPIYLFAVFVIMISGAGATLSEYYGLHPAIGRIAMAILSFVAVSAGLERLSKVLGVIGPIIIIFTVGVGLYSAVANFGELAGAAELLPTLAVSKPAPNGLIAGVLYASYNVLVVIALLGSLGATTDNEKEAKLGGLLGGTALVGAAAVMYIAIFSQIGFLHDKEIPFLLLADGISPLLGKLFSIILLLGIYSTAAPLLWQVTDRFVPDSSEKFRGASAVVALLGLLGGLLPFDTLVGTIYPFVGYLGIVIMIGMGVKVISLRSKGESGYEEMRKIESE